MTGRSGLWPTSEVKGKVALINCGSTEDGLKLVEEFVKQECRVVLVGNGLPLTTCLSAEQKSSNYVRKIELESRAGEEACRQAVENAWGLFGGIDVFINCNSGKAKIESVLDISEKDYDEIMDVNVKSSWKLSKAVARKMREAQTGGSIVFITSISGTERGMYPGVSVYGTSMAATNHLTKMMALELGKYGIRVNAVSCGLGGEDNLFQEKDETSVAEMARKIVPLQRWSHFPSDIIGVVLWLAGDSSTFVTGTISIVDGGQSISRPRLSSYL